MRAPRSSPLWLLGIAVCFEACGTPAVPSQAPGPVASASSSPASASPEPADDPLPTLRTGTIPPVDQPGTRELTLVARHVANGYETLAAVLTSDLEAQQESVSVDAASGPVPLAFVASPPRTLESRGHRWLWVRRPLASGDVTGDVFAASVGATPGKHYRFHIGAAGARPSDQATLIAWLDALTQQLRASSTPWTQSALARLDRISRGLAGDKKKGKAVVRPRPVHVRTGDLTGFLDTTTGLTAVQEALQSDRTLWNAAPEHKATIPLSTLTLPPLKHHPWSAMLARLAPAPVEALAADVPAEFYYLRAAGLGSLLDLLDQLDTWGTAAGEILEDVAEDRDMAARYQTQLALRTGPLTRALGPSVVGEVAVVGSDPYVEEGSDLTVLFRVKDRGLFDAGLAATQADLEKDHGSLVHETRDHGGVSVRVSRSGDGAVGQQRATLGDVEIVSNSPHAMDAVLDAAKGQRARLADEIDFEFMLARDAHERADVLAFLGDRFVAEVVGPRQKVLELRRGNAQGELMELGAAALLYGLIQGKSPTKVDDLLAAGLLAPEDLKHSSGEPITWQVGSSPRSAWGVPAAMTPLIDLPAPDRVSPGEKSAYQNFANGYQYNWSHYIDPVALRVAFDGSGAARTMTIGMRELPLIDQTQYSDVLDFVGTARFSAHPVSGGLRIVGGISHDSDLRKDVTRMFSDLSRDKLKLDWIGDWAAIGLADRSVIVKVMLQLIGDKIAQKPVEGGDSEGDLTLLATLPLYAEISVRSPAQAAIALAGARVLADSTIPGMFDWGEVGKYRDVPMVRVALKGDVARGLSEKSTEIDVFYAMANGALLVTMQDWLLRRLIDERLDGQGPSSAATGQGSSTQLSFDLASGPGKGLWTGIAWELEQEMLESGERGSRTQAEGLLRGAPEIAGDPVAMRALGIAYFGAAPVTADGQPYSLDKDGVHDIARGSAFAPTWPDVPVAGSPIERVLRALSSVSTQVSFDDEGKDGDVRMRSLHAVATLQLR